ncbi:ADP-ribose diphosphatase [Thiomicrorhabdus hydrogeniphila]
MKTKTLNIQTIKTVFKQFFSVKNIKFSHSLYQGGQSPLIEREVFCRGPAVVVLLYDLKAQKVVLVEQCRAGAIENALNQNAFYQAWLIEPVAGMIDLGETPEQACIREVKEETGADIKALEFINQCYPSPGACDEILHLYASQIDSTTVNTHAGLATEHEDIRVVTLSFKEAKQKLLAGDFNVATTYMALHWLFFQKLSHV